MITSLERQNVQQVPARPHAQIRHALMHRSGTLEHMQTFPLPWQGEAGQLSGRALVVNITSASNADVDAGGYATVISAASQAELLVAFSPAVNQARSSCTPRAEGL